MKFEETEKYLVRQLGDAVELLCKWPETVRNTKFDFSLCLTDCVVELQTDPCWLED